MPLLMSTLDVDPEELFVPSAGYGPLVSDASATQLPALEELDDDEVDEDEDEDEDEAVEVEVEDVPEDVLELLEPSLDSPPHPATSAAVPALKKKASARRRSIRRRLMVSRSWAKPRS